MKIITIVILILPIILSAQIKRINDEMLVNRISGPLEYLEQPFDVLHYDAELDFTAAPQKYMSGICRIHFVWKDDPSGNNFFFHLRGLLIDSSFYNDQVVFLDDIGMPESSIYHYEVPSMPVDKQGDTVILQIHYSGVMTNEYGSGTWGGVNSQSNILFSMGVGFLNNYVSSTQHWLPCYDHPSDKATFHAKFLVKNDMTVASVGLLNAEPRSDTTNIYEWTHNHQCATYLYTFAVGKYIKLESDHNGVPYVWFTNPSDSSASEYCLEKLPDMVDAFEEKFVKYPFDKVGYVNTPIGSMEHQTMVSMDTRVLRSYYVSKSKYCDVVAHELAHMWFGDYVCPLDFRHAWMNESFATFCESIWMESIDGYSAYIEKMDLDLKDYLVRMAPAEGVMPLYDFPRDRPSSNYPATIYYKGSVVLGMLRYELGDELFFAGVREFLNTYGDSSATTEDLKKAFEIVSGENLYWFFDQWVYGKGWPVLDVRLNQYNKSAEVFRGELYITQVQPEEYGRYHNLPIEIGFEYYNGETEYRIYTMKEKEEVFIIDTIKHVKTITINNGPTLRTLLKVNSIINSSEDETSNEKYLKISPNPAKDHINLNFYSERFENEFSVYNIFGQKVKTAIYIAAPGMNSARLDIQDLPEGVYFLTINDAFNRSANVMITR